MTQVMGALYGLKKKQIRDLERLIQRAVGVDQFVSPALAEEVCTLSLELHLPLTLLLDMQGRVYQVYVGSAAQLGEEDEVRMPEKAQGLCGLRAVTTQLGPMALPASPMLTTLLQYHLDALVTLVASPHPTWSVQFGEHPKACDAVYVTSLTLMAGDGEKLDVQTDAPVTLYQLEKQSLRDFLALKEAELGSFFQMLSRRIQTRERAFLLGIALPGVEGRCRAEDLLDELSLLAQTAGADVVGRLIQSRAQPDPQFYLGKGKTQALAFEVQQVRANLVIADDELSATQQRALERVLRTRVIDRTELILDIFAQRAQSWEGKIQVELAQLQYLLPRLTGRGAAFSQQTAAGRAGGAIATRGPGETKLELDRRRMRSRIAELERQAESVRSHRQLQRKSRQAGEMPVVALVGYTNAGKSTFLNTLTQAGTLSEDKLFATLDPLTRRLVRPGMPPCLLVDTVGFIQKLPTTLVKAFRATLEEIQSADLLLHLVDLSHPDRENQILAVDDTLATLDCQDKPQWLVLNKIDRVAHPQKEADSLAAVIHQRPVYMVSAKTGAGLPNLIDALGEVLQAWAVSEPIPTKD